ncbi:hypothetical protein Mapa_010114 [Marchantia paleacea]|nr:hypothetical protein Mapa_010114 [Marchantia paleacea]
MNVKVLQHLQILQRTWRNAGVHSRASFEMEKAVSATVYTSVSCFGRGWTRGGRSRPLRRADSRQHAKLWKRSYAGELQASSGALGWDSDHAFGAASPQSRALKLVGRDRDFALRLLNDLERQKGEQTLRQALHSSTVTQAQAQEQASSSPGGLQIPLPATEVLQPGLAQGTPEWLSLRRNRITASAFSTALGFWKGDRRAELWEEKIGIKEPFSGNEATRWGTTQEAGAVEKYKEITGNGVDHVAFKIYKAGDEYLSWLGASPDGLIRYRNDGEQPLLPPGQRLGILEVKCPHNKGRPELGAPWDMVPAYYMPQAQGLLEIYDREIMDFYVWTVNGSAVFRIRRDPEYWGFMFRIMSELWWGHIVPASVALKNGKSIADIQVFRPTEAHAGTSNIVQMSRDLARKSPMIWREHKGCVMKF